MIHRVCSALPVRLLSVAVVLAALGAGLLAGAHSSRPVGALAGYGTVSTGGGIIIEGHKVVVPIKLTTCTTPPATAIPTNTPTSTATNTSAPTATSTPTNAPTKTPTDTPPQDVPCRVGGYEMKMSFDSTKFTVQSDVGVSTGGNTTTVLRDTTKTWKVNQWAGSAITFTAGPVFGTYQILSNTSSSITLDTFTAGTLPFPTVPDTTSAYRIGGFTDGNFVFSTGRSGQCFGPTYGAGWAEIHCSTNGAPIQGYPDGPSGAGVVAAIAVQAGIGPAVRGLTNLNLNNPNGDSYVLQVGGYPIPADYPAGTRRIVICPDPNHDGVINSIDLGFTAQAFGKRPGDALYTVEKDPDANGVINSADLGIVAQLFNKRCVQT